MQPLLALLLAASPGPAPELLVPGLYAPGEVRAVDGDPYLALCAGRLVPVRVRVTRTAEGVTVAAPCEARALLRNVEGLLPGPVREASVRVRRAEARSSPFGPESLELRLGERRWRLDRIRLGSSGYRLQLHAPREQAVLYECQSTDRARWELLWAGDLDRDGKLDLLVDAADAEDLSEVRLYVSRGAEEAVDEAAFLRRQRAP
jgi:hypothetical protein